MMLSDRIARGADAILAENLARAIAPVIKQFGQNGAVEALIALAVKIEQGKFKSRGLN